MWKIIMSMPVTDTTKNHIGDMMKRVITIRRNAAVLITHMEKLKLKARRDDSLVNS